MDYRLRREEALSLWRHAIAKCDGIVTARTVQEFAALVAEDERERCAMICEETWVEPGDMQTCNCKAAADRIRAG